MLPESRMAALAVSVAAGVLAAAYLPILGWLLVGGVIFCAACVFWREKGRAVGGLMVLAYLMGAGNYAARAQIAGDDISRFTREVSGFDGIVAEDPDVREDRVRVVIRADKASISGRTQSVSGLVMTTIYVTEEMPRLAYGDRVRLAARPYLPFPPTNPGQFSWKDYLGRRGIYSCASVRDAADISLLPGQSGNPVMGMALAAKRRLAESIQRIHPNEEASVIIGMVLGTYAYLPKETLDNFSRTGTLHLLAASGFNCFLLVLLATPVLRLLRLRPSWISIVVSCLLVFYLMMVGFKPSLVRATVMAGLWLLAVPLGRVPNLRNLFFTAALVALAIRPSDIFDVGFQLSFAAVWALITSGDLIQATLQRFALLGNPKSKKRVTGMRNALRRVRGEVVSAAVATVTVTLYTAPIVAYHFNYVSLVSLPANIALALGVYVVFAVGWLAVVVSAVPQIGAALGFVGTKVTDAMLAVVNYLGSGTYSAVPIASPSPLTLLGYYVLLYVAMDWLRSLPDEG